MRVSIEKLTKIIQTVKPGLATRVVLQQTGHIIFTGKAVCTYNDRICIAYPFETDFQCSVNAVDLQKMLSGVRSEEFDLELKDSKLHIKDKNIRARLSTVLHDDHKVETLIYAIFHDMKTGTWARLPSDFLDAIFLCMFSASKDASKGALCCLGVKGNDVFSMDESRASWYKLDDNMPEFVFRAVDASKLTGLDSIKEILIKDNWIHFKTEDDVTFSARRMNVEYEDLRPLINSIVASQMTGSLQLPKDLKSTIERVSTMTEEDDDPLKLVVEIKIENNLLTCSSQNQRGDVEEYIGVAYSDEPLSFLFNPKFITEVLDKSQDISIYGNRAVFQTDKFTHVMSLPYRTK